jgi:hypothetical protein
VNLALLTRRAASWLTDSFRLVVASLYWNARKSVFVGRGRRGACPCFNPSDDPIAGQVRCRAVQMWADPARFRAVCPLLIQNDHGWCCSVDATGVRPFWGRTAAAWGAGVAGGYLTAVLIAFALFRWGVGVPVKPWQFAWPGSWHEVREAQAEMLFRRAMTAFAGGRPREALLALESARQIRPDHYPATRLLAQITMFQGSWAFSDGLFWHLLESQPTRRRETAIVYHDTLAALDRMDALADLCLQMVPEDPGQTAKWVRSLLFALQRSADPSKVLDARAAWVVRLPAHARLLVEAERSVAAKDVAGAIRQLRTPFGGPYNPIYLRAQVERLASLGAFGDAQVLLDFYAPMLGRFDADVTQLGLELARGDQWAARGQLGRLLEGSSTVEQFTSIAEQLIMRPNPDRARELHARARLLPRDDYRRVAAVIWVMALASGQAADGHAWRSEALAGGWASLPEISALDFSQHDPRDPRSPLNLIQAVELPREIVFALVARLERSPAHAVRSKVLP